MKDMMTRENFPQFKPDVWDKFSFAFARHMFTKKFEISEYKNILLGTGDKLIVYDSDNKAWGSGLDTNHPLLNSPSEWQGQNMLGAALMAVRQQLPNE